MKSEISKVYLDDKVIVSHSSRHINKNKISHSSKKHLILERKSRHGSTSEEEEVRTRESRNLKLKQSGINEKRKRKYSTDSSDTSSDDGNRDEVEIRYIQNQRDLRRENYKKQDYNLSEKNKYNKFDERDKYNKLDERKRYDSFQDNLNENHYTTNKSPSKYDFNSKNRSTDSYKDINNDIRSSKDEKFSNRDISNNKSIDRNTHYIKEGKDLDEKHKYNQISDKDNDVEKYWAAKRLKTSQNGASDGGIMTKTGGAYIPPAKLRMMQAQLTDKSSIQYQRMAWEALKKSIHGLINKVTVNNIREITDEIFQENIVRGRGLLVRSLIQAQSASLSFTHVYTALVAIINTKIPQIGELIVKRLIIMFRKGFKRNNKVACLSSVSFLAHLVNQQVAHEIVALEILTLLMEKPTDDSVEVAVGFLKECGSKLTQVSPRGIQAVFDRLRTILHEAYLDKRVQYMIEVMFAIRKDGFKDHLAITSELDLVEEDDQFTHMLTLEDEINQEDALNVFKLDPNYEENEVKYKSIKDEILNGGDSEADGEDDEGDDSSENENKEVKSDVIIDNTETNLTSLRKTIYLTIQSSLDFEECAHKLLKMQWKPGQTMELCNMILDCCAQQRTYEKFFGLLAQRFCMIDRKYIEPYQQIFKEQYETIHRLETNKLRNVAKFYVHLLYSDAISWEVLECIKLNEDNTTSSSRIFIKILFQELAEYMGLTKLNNKLKDVTLQSFFEGMFPRDNPRNTRFAVNFFTSIGLGGLTDELREHLKTATKPQQVSNLPDILSNQQKEQSSSEDDSSSDNDSSSSQSSSSSSSVENQNIKKISKKSHEKSRKKPKEDTDKRLNQHREKNKNESNKKYSNKQSNLEIMKSHKDHKDKTHRHRKSKNYEVSRDESHSEKPKHSKISIKNKTEENDSNIINRLLELAQCSSFKQEKSENDLILKSGKNKPNEKHENIKYIKEKKHKSKRE